MSDSQEIKKMLIGLAEFYGETLSAGRLILCADVLSEFTAVQVKKAVDTLIRDPKVTRFPFPAQIAALIKPSDNPDGEANEAANRIHEAMAKIGYGDPARARQFIGELGWLVVERQGGWAAVCENTLAHQMPTLKAQWRELAKALYHRAKQGTLEQAPGLPAASAQPERLSGLLKLVGDKK